MYIHHQSYILNYAELYYITCCTYGTENKHILKSTSNETKKAVSDLTEKRIYTKNQSDK